MLGSLAISDSSAAIRGDAARSVKDLKARFPIIVRF